MSSHGSPFAVVPDNDVESLATSTPGSYFRDEDNRSILETSIEEMERLGAPQPQLDADEQSSPRHGRTNRQSMKRWSGPPVLPGLTPRTSPPPQPSSPSSQSLTPLMYDGPAPDTDYDYATPVALSVTSPGAESSDVETMNGDEEGISVVEGQEQRGNNKHASRAAAVDATCSRTQEKFKSYEQFCILLGIVLLLVAGGIVVYLVTADSRGGSNPQDNGDDSNGGPPREVDVQVTKVPTLSPTASPITVPPTMVPTGANNTITASPTLNSTEPPVVDFQAPWVVDLTHSGLASGDHLGEALAIAADGTRLVVADGNGTLQMLNVSSGLLSPQSLGEALATTTGDTAASLLSVDMNSKGTTLAAGLDDGSVLMYSFDYGTFQWSLLGTLQIWDFAVELMSLSLSGDGNRLAVCAIGPKATAHVQLWVMDEVSKSWEFVDENARTGNYDGLHIDLSADGTMLAIARRRVVSASFQNGFVSILRVEPSGETFELTDAGFIATGSSSARVSLSANGNRLAVSNVDDLNGGWTLYTLNSLSGRWTHLPAAAAGLDIFENGAINAILSLEADKVAIVDKQGAIYLRQQVIPENSLNWVTTPVTSDAAHDESLLVAFSLDGNALAIGKPWYSSGETVAAGLVEIYRGP